MIDISVKSIPSDFGPHSFVLFDVKFIAPIFSVLTFLWLNILLRGQRQESCIKLSIPTKFFACLPNYFFFCLFKTIGMFFFLPILMVPVMKFHISLRFYASCGHFISQVQYFNEKLFE